LELKFKTTTATKPSNLHPQVINSLSIYNTKKSTYYVAVAVRNDAGANHMLTVRMNHRSGMHLLLIGNLSETS